MANFTTRFASSPSNRKPLSAARVLIALATIAGCTAIGANARPAADDIGIVLGDLVDAGLPSYDVRTTADGLAATQALRDGLTASAKNPARATALARLQTKVEGLTVDADHLFGTPRFVRSCLGYLTTESPDAPPAVIERFLTEYADLFEIDSTEVAAARKTRDFVSTHTGVTHLTYQQQHGGIDIFDAGIKANVTAKGQLINISSTMLPRPKTGFAVPAAKLSDLEAIRAAAASVGVTVKTDPTPAIDPQGPGQKRRWNNSPDFRLDQPITTERVLFPITRDSLRAAWYVSIPTRGVGHTYDLVIDALDGSVLHRVDELCDDVGSSTLRVYPGRAPFPNPTPAVAGVPYPADSRRLITINPSDPALVTASPFGWFDTNGVAGADSTETRGNNVDAHLDRNADNIADLPRPSGGASLVFSPTLDVAAQPVTWSDASVVHAFYLANLYHDRLYALGFTEAAGNFQTNNYGRGGTGNDAVQLDCQDGSGTNNANFASPADGTAGRCQMFIWTSTSPQRDSGMDAEILFHELTHGLSNRLTGGPANASALNNIQSGGMGEGWSDFVALCLDARAGDDPNGQYPVANYSAGNANGIRRFPYSTNPATNPLNFDAYGTAGTTLYGVNRSTEVHNTGELWCSTLWDCRAALFQTRGADVANNLILQLVVDGMKLQPANPTFMQARDAILQADLTLTGGANRNTLWLAFAKRGLGASASTASSAATAVVQGFDIPEGTDVGELPATAGVLAGNGALTRISGTLSTGNVDMYRINVCDFANFSATTVGLATINTQLFLFDSTGLPVTFNDDASATTQSRITGQFLSANGDYYLAISGADRDPVSSTGEIWIDTPTTTERQATGPGAGRVVLGWTGTDATAGGAYTIQLTGACGATVGAFAAEARPLTAYGSPTPGVLYYGSAGTSVRFNLFVNAGTLPASSGIVATVDASSIGVGTVTLLDGGVAPDTTAGDRVFSASRTIASLPAGDYDLPYHVSDGQGRSFDSTILLTVVDTPGACCLPTGGCDFLTHAACDAQFGQFAGSGISCSISPCSAAPEIEPNDTIALATSAAPSFRNYSGNLFHIGISAGIATTSDSDFFNIGSLQVGDVLTVSESGPASLGGSLSDPLVRLLRSNGNNPTVVLNDDDSGPGTDSLIWKFTITAADTYIVRGSRFSTTLTGTYRLGISLENADSIPLTGSIFNNEVEPNDTNLTPNNVTSAWRPVQYIATTYGTLTAGDADLFSYPLTAGDLVSINIAAGSGLDARVDLVSPSGATIASEDGTSTGPSGDSPIIAFNIPTTGTYYLRVLAASGTGNYYAVLHLSTDTPPVTPCPSDFNHDGETNPDDLADFIGCYFQQPPCVPSDFNGDGETNPDDLADFIGAFFGSSC